MWMRIFHFPALCIVLFTPFLLDIGTTHMQFLLPCSVLYVILSSSHCKPWRYDRSVIGTLKRTGNGISFHTFFLEWGWTCRKSFRKDARINLIVISLLEGRYFGLCVRSSGVSSKIYWHSSMHVRGSCCTKGPLKPRSIPPCITTRFSVRLVVKNTRKVTFDVAGGIECYRNSKMVELSTKRLSTETSVTDLLTNITPSGTTPECTFTSFWVFPLLKFLLHFYIST